MKTRCKPGDISSPDPKEPVFIRPRPGSFGDDICRLFETLPQDFELRHKVVGEILAIIKEARNQGQLAKSSKRVDVPYLRLVKGGCHG